MILASLQQLHQHPVQYMCINFSNEVFFHFLVRSDSQFKLNFLFVISKSKHWHSFKKNCIFIGNVWVSKEGLPGKLLPACFRPPLSPSDEIRLLSDYQIFGIVFQRKSQYDLQILILVALFESIIKSCLTQGHLVHDRFLDCHRCHNFHHDLYTHSHHCGDLKKLLELKNSKNLVHEVLCWRIMSWINFWFNQIFFFSKWCLQRWSRSVIVNDEIDILIFVIVKSKRRMKNDCNRWSNGL